MSTPDPGRLVRIKTKYLEGKGWLIQLWAAAVDDDSKAIEIVRTKDGTLKDEKVDVIGVTSAEFLADMRIAKGDAKPYP
jgi:hypothetical protein